MNVESEYHRFLTLTGDAAAAATLVLAAVQTAERVVFTPAEVGEQLRTAPETVIGWIRSGQLKASNLATGARPRYVVQPADLETFLTKRQPEKPAPRGRKAKSSPGSYRKFSE